MKNNSTPLSHAPVAVSVRKIDIHWLREGNLDGTYDRKRCDYVAFGSFCSIGSVNLARLAQQLFCLIIACLLTTIIFVVSC